MKAFALLLFATTVAGAQQSSWIHAGPDGRLVYNTTPRGDRIVDFSYAGYMGGGVSLPMVPVAETVSPSGGDDTAAIQAALNRAAAKTAEDHKTLAVVLAVGVFHLADTLSMTASHVVLRGSGSSQTVLALTGKPHLAIRIGEGTGVATDEDAETDATTSAVASSTLAAGVYVPSGAQVIQVASAKGFAAGDTVQIDHPITPAYEAFMHMDHLVRSGTAEHWVGSHIVVERRVTKVEGNALILDVPLTDNYDPKFGGGVETVVKKINPPRRLSQVGVESLAIACPPLHINLSDPHFDGIAINSTEDAWLRDVHMEDTTNSVSVESAARRITIAEVEILQRIAIESPAKPFAFSLAGTQTLVMLSKVRGDKLFFAATQAREQGPNVLLYCTFEGGQSVEPHQRWGTGFLVDNVTVKGGAINFINRGTMGSGHGWTMGWGVVWNSAADTLSVQSPPGAMNWAIGAQGQRVGKPMPISGQGSKNGAILPEGIFDSPGKRVKPESLYLQQLRDRLGAQAAHNIEF